MDKMKEIEKIFAKRVKLETIDANVELRTLGLDSLDLVEVMMDIEDEFGVQFENEEMVSFKTVADVQHAIEKKIKK